MSSCPSMRAVVVLGLASVVWSAGCDRSPEVPPAEDEAAPEIAASMQDPRRDCPSHRGLTLASAGVDSIYQVLSVPKEITLVPEFHDCQRLLIDAATSYGPLVGVFASNDLGAAQAASIAGHLPVAELVNFDPVSYPPLGIKPNFNCLYMFRDSMAANGIRAIMVSVNLDEKACEKVYDPAMAGTELHVQPYTPEDPLTWEDIPAVARWDWDPKSRRQYIGIRCDMQWCEVGASGFSPSEGHKHPFSEKKEKRTFWIKGWYDEQRLAVRVGNGLRPLQSVGTIVPDSALDDYSNTSFPKSRWVAAARVAVRPYHPTYQAKLGIGPVPDSDIPNKMNRLELCNAAWGDCAAAAGDSPPQPTKNCTGATIDWWARMITPTGTTKYFCVIRTAHTHALVGTARWRWLLQDETIWVRCAEGCCQVNSEEQ